MWLRILEPELKDGRKSQWQGANVPQKHVCFPLFRDFSSHDDRGDILMKHYTSEWLFKFWVIPDQISWTFPFLTCQVECFMKQDSIQINLIFFILWNTSTHITACRVLTDTLILSQWEYYIPPCHGYLLVPWQPSPFLAVAIHIVCREADNIKQKIVPDFDVGAQGT